MERYRDSRGNLPDSFNTVFDGYMSGETRKTRFYYHLFKDGHVAGSIPEAQAFKIAVSIDSLISFLTDWHGDNWDIVPLFNFDNAISEGVGILDFKIRVLTKYDSITITNSEGFEHEILDMIVCSTFAFFKGPAGIHMFPSDVLASRVTLNIRESFNGYFHSHLPASQNLRSNNSSDYSYFIRNLKYSRFCTGESSNTLGDFLLRSAERAVELGSLTSEDDIPTASVEDIGRYYAMLDSLLYWESLEGVPYRYISRVISTTSNIYNTRSLYSGMRSEYTITFSEMSKELCYILATQTPKAFKDILRSLTYSYSNGRIKIVTDTSNILKQLIIILLRLDLPQNYFEGFSEESIEELENLGDDVVESLLESTLLATTAEIDGRNRTILESDSIVRDLIHNVDRDEQSGLLPILSGIQEGEISKEIGSYSFRGEIKPIKLTLDSPYDPSDRPPSHIEDLKDVLGRDILKFSRKFLNLFTKDLELLILKLEIYHEFN